MRTPRLFRLLLLPVLLISAAGLPPANAAEFTPAQRDEIVHIVRDALRQDPSILRDAVTALQAEEGAHQAVATRAALEASHQALVADPADPVAGNLNGDVTVVEFFDTRCPYCRRLDPVMASLLTQDHGVRVVYKDLPVLGPASVIGSKALLASQRQADQVPGAYDRLRSALMRSGADQTKDGILNAARHLGIDAARLDQDMNDPAIQRRIDANLRLAQTLGIQGTPALVIGNALIPGAVELPELEQAVKAARSAGG